MGTDANRYGTYQSTRLPREKRTIPISGHFDDDGKFYRCWNCGFINHIDRAPIGVGSGISTVSGVGMSWVDRDNQVWIDRSDYIFDDRSFSASSQVGSGCSFCGSRNWR